MSQSSARLPAPKLHVQCTCGRKYRVPVSKAGKKIACKSCGEQLRVPRQRELSERSRGNILAELGIDPVAAEQAYNAELERSTKKRTYTCTRCEGEIGANELKGAYIKGELVCPGCRASAQVEDRRAEREAQTEKRAESDQPDPTRARRGALV